MDLSFHLRFSKRKQCGNASFLLSANTSCRDMNLGSFSSVGVAIGQPGQSNVAASEDSWLVAVTIVTITIHGYIPSGLDYLGNQWSLWKTEHILPSEESLMGRQSRGTMMLMNLKAFPSRHNHNTPHTKCHLFLPTLPCYKRVRDIKHLSKVIEMLGLDMGV